MTTPSSPDKVLADIKLTAAWGTLHLTRHAQERMAARSVVMEDVTAAIATATVCTYSSTEDTWRVEGGQDLDGTSLIVVLSIRGSVLRLITVI